MNFVWFIIVLVLFEVLFWHYILMILGLPGMAAMPLLIYATENTWRKWIKWLLLPVAMVLAFIFGTGLIAFVYGGTLALIAQHFAENTSYPWIYWVICGIAAFYIMAPSGETNLLAMLLSLVSYLLVIFSNILTGVLGGILTIVATIFQLIVGIAILGLICYGLFSACNWILDKIYLKGKYQETESLQRNIALFKGYVLTYFLWILSPLWLLLPLTILFGNQLVEELTGDITFAVFAFVAFVLYVILLSRVYIVSKKLKEEGFLKTSGFSMLVIAILLTLSFQLGVFILFIVLWVKSNRYLKTQPVPLVEPQISDLLIAGETYENDCVKETSGFEIVPSINNIQEEISVWETRLSEKENEASDLSIQVQDINNMMNLFLGEYYLRVGILYVKLDKLKLRIKEYERRIDVAQGRKLTSRDLESVETEVDETFSEERHKLDDLESEASGSAQEYQQHLQEEEKKQPFDHEFQQELKKLYRRLALKFHPDKAKDDKQRKKFNKIFAAVAEAYKNGDLETLKKYMKQAEREEKITKETLEEKLARLKEEYESILAIIAKLRAELEDLKANETYKLMEKVDQAKKESRDLLQELAADIKEEIAEKQAKLDTLVAKYKKIIDHVAY